MAILITEENKDKPPKQPFRVTWAIEVLDKDMKTVIERKSGENSLVAGFAFMIFNAVSFQDGSTEHNTANTLSVGYQWYPATVSAPACFPTTSGYNHAGSTPYGIVLGTNNTPVTADDYKLNTLIVAGSAASQLNYWPQTNTAVVTDATTSSFRQDRMFQNATAGTITVKELGFYSLYINTTFAFCLCRDIIADPGTDITAGQYMFVHYTITITEA